MGISYRAWIKDTLGARFNRRFYLKHMDLFAAKAALTEI